MGKFSEELVPVGWARDLVLGIAEVRWLRGYEPQRNFQTSFLEVYFCYEDCTKEYKHKFEENNYMNIDKYIRDTHRLVSCCSTELHFFRNCNI